MTVKVSRVVIFREEGEDYAQKRQVGGNTPELGDFPELDGGGTVALWVMFH